VTGETFGAMLRRLRIAAGLSQNQLARQAGVDPAYVNRLERAGQQTRTGRTIQYERPGRATFLALAEALDISTGQTDRLLFLVGHAPQTDWQTRAVRAETALATIRQAFDDHAEADDTQPTFIRSRVG
jgi:transcriptional regulator with XRE-family HTH domain